MPLFLPMTEVLTRRPQLNSRPRATSASGISPSGPGHHERGQRRRDRIEPSPSASRPRVAVTKQRLSFAAGKHENPRYAVGHVAVSFRHDKSHCGCAKSGLPAASEDVPTRCLEHERTRRAHWIAVIFSSMRWTTWPFSSRALRCDVSSRKRNSWYRCAVRPD